MRRVLDVTVLVLMLAVLAAIGLGSLGSAPSTNSSYDTGPNGYRALYDVLERENVPVSRLEGPLGTRDPAVRVIAVTDPHYDSVDVRRLQAFMREGGTVLAFGRIDQLKASAHLRYFNVDAYTNAALRRHPRRALAIYDALAGKGLVAFDEREHGYDRTQSLWAVLPRSVHVAVGVAALAVLLALIDANVRFAPPVVREPPADRDSSDYVRSMAALLRRARAGRATIERFARAYPASRELAALAATSDPSDAQVLRAATIYAELRKEHA